MYKVILDDVPGRRLTLKEGCIKYVSSISRNTVSTVQTPEALSEAEKAEDILEDAIQDEDDEVVEEIDLTNNEGYRPNTASINLINARNARPLDYFLFFLPFSHLCYIISNIINTHARSILEYWIDVSIDEYLMWIALLTVMTVFRHSDRKAY
ncbi:hypothetical protein MAM1_1237c11528 [Mucor ambiguus]|uniref:PiggyBac transposable element-derived protein domain-containing protein n=1 Tax=Mucor ambiguus TaxID=91626 RepID=A0A0C9MX00_9FUNG|nr:hypothetical protein MAM1_1237c11528 [Mucor ambiguus]